MANVSNQLDWMNKHLVLLQHPTVLKTVQEENYPARTEQLELAEKFPSSEDFVHELDRQGEYKDACCFLAYDMHKRAAVWWAYLCVLDLLSELKKAPHKPRSIDDIGKPRPFKLPDWAKAPDNLPKPKDPEVEIEKFHAYQKKAWADYEKTMKNIDPRYKQEFDEAFAIFDNEIKKVQGMGLFELFDMAAEKYIRSQGQDFTVDIENSPITKATNELKEKIEKVRTDTIAKVKAALPKVDVKARTKHKGSALDFTYSYIVSPDEVNADRCLEIGNKITDTPEGLLALVAFWSFGDLSPKGNTVVKTPAGLMANGLNNLLLMLALAEGGEKTFEQRFETYFKLGFEVATGKNNWTGSVHEGKVPHSDLVVAQSEGEAAGAVPAADPYEQKSTTAGQTSKPATRNIEINRFK